MHENVHYLVQVNMAANNGSMERLRNHLICTGCYLTVLPLEVWDILFLHGRQISLLVLLSLQPMITSLCLSRLRLHTSVFPKPYIKRINARCCRSSSCSLSLAIICLILLNLEKKFIVIFWKHEH